MSIASLWFSGQLSEKLQETLRDASWENVTLVVSLPQEKMLP
jgi:hypothetical protein